MPQAPPDNDFDVPGAHAINDRRGSRRRLWASFEPKIRWFELGGVWTLGLLPCHPCVQRQDEPNRVRLQCDGPIRLYY